MMKHLRECVLAVFLASMSFCGAINLHRGIEHLPYTDGKAWHLGFSVGMHVQDIAVTHNGFITEGGRTWFVDQPSYSPGFCVNGLIDFRLNDYLNLRVSPGLWYGSRTIKMADTTLGGYESQNMKSTFVVLPLDIKFSGMRLLNSRPYVTTGLMGAVDLSKKQRDFLKFKSTDVYLTFGVGCDFYLPFFKWNPEIKFCLGLTDILDHRRKDLADDPVRMEITNSLKKVKSKMIVITFYFE
ncbi:MAG: PorT family protein [Paramuribaculum sp.]|nr:PorT family protein [Paramuribaculum sp.]